MKTRGPKRAQGRYSKVLPNRLVPAYNSSLSDPGLLGLRAEIAVVDARIGDLLQRVDSGESEELWVLVKDAFGEYTDARARGSVPDMTAALGKLENLIKTGVDDYGAWREIGREIDQRRKLAESERRAALEGSLMIAADEVLSLLTAVSIVIKEHVQDTDTLRAISDGIRLLVPGDAK